MQNDTLLNRRDFTLQSALAVLSGVAITISGCGGRTSPSPTAPSPGVSGDVTGSISANHGHAAVMTRAQLTAANAVSLNIQGSSGHPHTVELSQSDVVAIANGQQVFVASTTDAGHQHTVTFN